MSHIVLDSKEALNLLCVHLTLLMHSGVKERFDF